MVDPKLFKEKIETLVSQDYKIEFLGEDFDQIVRILTDAKAEKIYFWIEETLRRNIQPITIGEKKPYKEWSLNQLLIFRYQMNIANNEYRILLVKVKNSIYIEFHLGNHKYYDRIRKDLSLKKSSY